MNPQESHLPKAVFLIIYYVIIKKNSQSGTISIGMSDNFMTNYTRKVSKGQISKRKYAKIRYLKITQRKNVFLNFHAVKMHKTYSHVMC